MKILPLILMLIPCSLSGQQSNYWSQQFGPRSALLGGAVVAGVRDHSAIFYNPSRLGVITNKNLSVSANGYELDLLHIPDGAGTGIELNSRTLNVMPLIISGIFKLQRYPRHTIGYCLLTRDQFNIKMSARHEAVLNVISDHISPGPEDYTGQYVFKSSVYEMLTGWGYGCRISDHISIGLGNYGSYRSFHTDTYMATRAVSLDTVNVLTRRMANYTEMKYIELKNIRTVLKLGVSGEWDKFKAGLTVTSPSMNVFGWSTVMEDLTVNNMNMLGIDSLISFVASDRQEGLKSTYKTPLSVAIGLEYTLQKTLLSVTAEWFDRVGVYSMVTPEDKDLVQPDGFFSLSSSDLLQVKDYKRSLVNVAVAFEQPLSKRLFVAGSFRTNQSFSNHDSLGNMRVNFTDWNIYHAVMGITRKNEKSDLSIGLAYGFGRARNVRQWANLTEPTEQRLLTGNLQRTSVFYRTFSLMIGYTYYFK